MKTKKRGGRSSASRFTRGVKIGAKRRHGGRKMGRKLEETFLRGYGSREPEHVPIA